VPFSSRNVTTTGAEIFPASPVLDLTPASFPPIGCTTAFFPANAYSTCTWNGFGGKGSVTYWGSSMMLRVSVSGSFRCQYGLVYETSSGTFMRKVVMKSAPGTIVDVSRALSCVHPVKPSSSNLSNSNGYLDPL